MSEKKVKVRNHYQSHDSGVTLSFHFTLLKALLSLVGQVDCLETKMSQRNALVKKTHTHLHEQKYSEHKERIAHFKISK